MNIEIKKEIDEIMAKQGDVKGETLRNHFTYIKEREGDRGLKKVEKILEEYGYSLKMAEIEKLSWYKDGYCGIILLILKKFFQWEEKDFIKMGQEEAKYSFIITKILLKYLISLDTLVKEAPKAWEKHLNFGSVEIPEYDKDNKFVIIKVKDYDMHPLTCLYQRGYYAGLFKYVIKTDNIVCEEQKCLHKGDEYHQYKLSWQ